MYSWAAQKGRERGGKDDTANDGVCSCLHQDGYRYHDNLLQLRIYNVCRRMIGPRVYSLNVKVIREFHHPSVSGPVLPVNPCMGRKTVRYVNYL